RLNFRIAILFNPVPSLRPQSEPWEGRLTLSTDLSRPERAAHITFILAIVKLFCAPHVGRVFQTLWRHHANQEDSSRRVGRGRRIRVLAAARLEGGTLCRQRNAS